MTLKLASLFETPVIMDMLPDAVPLNRALSEVIARQRSASPGVRKSNWNGWQSETDMTEWGGDAAIALAEHFLTLCENFTALPAGLPLQWSVEMWANVSPPGASNEAHVHPGVVWSAVYYVDAGAGKDVADGSGGELVLYDPRMPFVRMLPFELRYRRPDGTAADSQAAIRPVAGQIVMFPPWLLHSVHPHRGPGERISIAMNATVVAA